jgi:hypothetical protein
MLNEHARRIAARWLGQPVQVDLELEDAVCDAHRRLLAAAAAGREKRRQRPKRYKSHSPECLPASR